MAVLRLILLFNAFLLVPFFAEEPWSVSRENPVTAEAMPSKQKASLRDTLKNEYSMVSLAFRFYQKYITDLDDSRCHYTPTCSVYSAWALRKYGFFKGLLMSSDRLIRCHTGQTEYRYDPPIDY